MMAVMKMLLVQMLMAITLVIAKMDSLEMDSIAQVIFSFCINLVKDLVFLSCYVGYFYSS